MDKQEMIAALETYKKEIEAKQAELLKAANEKADALKKEVEALEAKRAEMQKQLDEQNIEIQVAKKSQMSKAETLTLEAAIKELLASDDFKKAKAEKFNKNNTFTVKADTGDITGTVNMTVQRLQVGFAPERALAFIPGLSTGFIGQDKNRVLWVEGTYTSNAGYVGEGTGQTTADAGAAAEKSRAMAKISAKLPLTAELLEDAEYIASAFRMKMQEKALQFLDGEVYEGDGNDSTQPNHVYGIKGHATAFNASVIPADALVEDANVGDLVDAMILQAETLEQRGLNTLYINPKDFFRFRTLKSSDGSYLFVKDVNGNYTINGLRVVRSNRVDAGTLTALDSSKVQLWWKRNPEIKFSQMNGTDFVDDSYTAVMFLRCQVVVEAADKTAIIHVADITTELSNILKTGA